MYIKNLIRNIKYLLKHSLLEEKDNMIYSALIRVEDVIYYELNDGIGNTDALSILDYEQTVDLLISQPKSFCRFGDGEIEIILGTSVAYQEYDPLLAERLLYILQNNISDLYVGINYNYFHNTKQMNESNRKFYLLRRQKYRDFLIRNCTKERIYIAAGFNQISMCFDKEKFDVKGLYKKIRNIFKDQELVIFAGEKTVSTMKNDVFELARSKEFVKGPSNNSFSRYNELLQKAKTYPKTKILCFVLGPTSKILVHDLTKEGYMAWDLGHLIKDYDYFCVNG